MLKTRAQTLQVTANMKANQIAQYISLFSDSVVSIGTRDKLQEFMQEYNSGNTTVTLRSDLSVSVIEDVSTALAANLPRLTSSMLSLEARTNRSIYRLPSIHEVPPTTPSISRSPT